MPLRWLGMPGGMTQSETVRKVRQRASQVAAEYAGGEPRPLSGYVLTMGTYAGTAALLLAASRLADADVPERPAWSDLALSALGGGAG